MDRKSLLMRVPHSNLGLYPPQNRNFTALRVFESSAATVGRIILFFFKTIDETKMSHPWPGICCIEPW